MDCQAVEPVAPAIGSTQGTMSPFVR